VAESFTRILSDIHYGDRASRVRSLDALRPLFDGPEQIVFNGDTLDTRPSRNPDRAIALAQEAREFIAQRAPAPVVLTGNHDPDFSPRHSIDLGAGSVFVTHGDVLFDDLVPWSRDAALARRLIAEELAALPVEARDSLAAHFAATRRAAARIPQRHQAEPHGLKYFASFIADTVWPPMRPLRILRAWREVPNRAAGLARRHRPDAQFFVMGHTHRLGVWRTPEGITVLNTGAYCPPTGAGVVDVSAERVVLRAVERRGDEFHPGEIVAEFPLTPQ
jgi:exonuclease SbcD